MPRYALKVEYHGGPFAGWQRQADQPSVQGAIEAALAKLVTAQAEVLTPIKWRANQRTVPGE